MLDRDALWAVYDRYSMPNDVQEERGLGFDAFVQEVEAAVRPAAIDRLRLNTILDDLPIEDEAIVPLADAIVALVRPVAGVTLTPEDKALIVDVLREIPEIDRLTAGYRPSRQQEIDDRLALAARLEAGS